MPGPQNQSGAEPEAMAPGKAGGEPDEAPSFAPPDLPDTDTFSTGEAEGAAALDKRPRTPAHDLPDVDTFSTGEAEGGAALDELQRDGKPVPGAD
jgi:hypothetical protein